MVQSAMGTLQAENTKLREENESNRPLLDLYFQDVLSKAFGSRLLLGLNRNRISDASLEGLLVILTTICARPVP